MSSEREKFEEKFTGRDLERDGEGYKHPLTNTLWIGWQAHAAETKSPAETDVRRIERRNRIQEERGILQPLNYWATEQYQEGWEAAVGKLISLDLGIIEQVTAYLSQQGDGPMVDRLRQLDAELAAIRALEPPSPPSTVGFVSDNGIGGPTCTVCGATMILLVNLKGGYAQALARIQVGMNEAVDDGKKDDVDAARKLLHSLVAYKCLSCGSTPELTEASSLEHSKRVAANCNAKGHPLTVHRCACGIKQLSEPQPPVVEQKEKA